MQELSEIIVYIAKSGVFALLFTLLLFYILRDSRARERKYQQVIESLAESLNVVKSIATDVREMKKTAYFNQAVSSPNYKASKVNVG